MKSGSWAAFQSAAELNYDNHPDDNRDLLPGGTMTNLDDLNICPNCNGPAEIVTDGQSTAKFWAECQYCRLAGPQVDTEEEAVRDWNNLTMNKGTVSVYNSRGGFCRPGMVNTSRLNWEELIGEIETDDLNKYFPKNDWILMACTEDVAVAVQNFIAAMLDDESLIRMLRLLSQKNIVEARVVVKSTEELKLLPVPPDALF